MCLSHPAVLSGWSEHRTRVFRVEPVLCGALYGLVVVQCCACVSNSHRRRHKSIASKSTPAGDSLGDSYEEQYLPVDFVTRVLFTCIESKLTYLVFTDTSNLGLIVASSGED